MTHPSKPTVALSEMVPGQEGDLFALLTAKEELTTRDGKPYFRVTFRDARREVTFPIWSDSPWAVPCRDEWQPGQFYKIRGLYRDTPYGPQLEIRRIRAATEADRADGFDPRMLLPRSRFDPHEVFSQLEGIVSQRIQDPALRSLVEHLLSGYRSEWLTCPAAQRQHHAYTTGLLEHTLSVARNAVFLADRYGEYYPDMQPPLNKDLVVAGAVLHDIGKIRELAQDPTGTRYTAAGTLVGHILQGRDMVREAAGEVPIDPELLLRLEHVIVSHQRLPEWGSPKEPMTPEALLVHYADDVDAKYHILYRILAEDTTAGPFTSTKNLTRQKVYRGGF